MPRAALFALLVASILGGSSLQAQRLGATFHSSSVARMPSRSGFVGQRGSPNRFISTRSHFHQNTFGPAFFPYDEPFGYTQTDTEAVTDGAVPLVVIPRPDEWQSRMPEPPPTKPLVINVPGAANSTAARTSQPTIFILANGERLEARWFVLTASNLSVSIDRQQRTVPFDMLDINATISANHELGIDLRIPADPNEISLSF
jgi:hypothetical protein